MTVSICKNICPSAGNDVQDLPTNNPPVTPAVTGMTMLPTDFEATQSSVCDLTTSTWHTITTRYEDGVAQTPIITDTGVPCSPEQSILREPFCQCFIDDVNGDGSELVEFSRGFIRTIQPDNSITVVTLGDFTDSTFQNQYDPVGTVTACAMVGTDAELLQNRIELDGGVWSPTALVESYTIRVISGTGVTFTDSNGVVTPIVANEVLSYDSEDEHFETSPIVTVPAGNQVVITYTELGA